MTLAAHANLCARAEYYKRSGAFPKAKMDQLRAMAYLDLLNGITAETRVAKAQARASSVPSSTDSADSAPDSAPDSTDGEDGESDGPDDGQGPGDDGGDDSRGGGPGGGGPDDDAPSSPGIPPAFARPRTDLVIPLATLLGLAKRPGEAHGLGPLDPALCRDLADLAASSLTSEFCVTVTDFNGIAIGHGCVRTQAYRNATISGLTSLPARVNLTISQADLQRLADVPSRNLPSRDSPWALAPRHTDQPRNDHGPPGGFGTWILVLPGGREFIVRLEQVPTFECDHAHESHAYQANDTLRHLVEVRDGNCTFPPCNRRARECDFEHAVPYHRGGRTCACNAGARSRKCHRIKQAKGWKVTQPRPGFHQWTTPSGRIYTQEPKRYPV